MSLLDKERINKIIQYGEFGGEVTFDQWYVRYQFEHVEICLRPEDNWLDFWIQKPNHAWVEVSIAWPPQHNAMLSGCMRWIFGEIVKKYNKQDYER